MYRTRHVKNVINFKYNIRIFKVSFSNFLERDYISVLYLAFSHQFWYVTDFFVTLLKLQRTLFAGVRTHCVLETEEEKMLWFSWYHRNFYFFRNNMVSSNWIVLFINLRVLYCCGWDSNRLFSSLQYCFSNRQR